jgi:3-deoxy-D-manno-oct-2-ulosonic acid (Kdo) hydroxylase
MSEIPSCQLFLAAPRSFALRCKVALLRGGIALSATPEIIEITGWEGPFPEAVRLRALAALENGKVLYFPNLAFELAESERFLLSPALSDGRAKNISLDPASGSLRGTLATDRERPHLQAMMEAFAAAATRLVSDLFPSYAANLERARASYRPVEIAGRRYSRLKDDTLLHVDAFPSTPTQGRRILRIFSNINPSGKPRIWRVGEPFQDFAQKFLPALGRPVGGVAWLLETVGATKGRRSVYDQLMLRLHNRAKRNFAYQHSAPEVEVAFPAGTSWLCYTDQVVHAAVAGQYALEQTFHLDIGSMADPARSPVQQLERMTDQQLR